MRFVWDPGKALANLKKHGVAFEDAVLVWSDPLLEIIEDRSAFGEERWLAFGRAGAGGTLVVVHVHPDPADDGTVRLISARKATRHEQRRYEDGDL